MLSGNLLLTWTLRPWNSTAVYIQGIENFKIRFLHWNNLKHDQQSKKLFSQKCMKY